MLLTVADHDAIRGAIDARLGPRDLSDALLSSEIYRPAADAEVQRRDPAWAGRTGVARDALRRAAIYLCAAKLCPVAPVLTSETVSRWSGSREPIDLGARAMELRALAETELAGVLNADGAVAVPTIFIAAPGRWGL